MSCNGCRVLRKGCNDNCVLRPCLQWIDSADAQGNATVFVAKFFGRAGLMGFIDAVPEDQRAALFQSLLYEACGRTVNPVHGALGLLWSGKWNVCEAAVETVLKGGSLKPCPQGMLQAAVAPVGAGNNSATGTAFPRSSAAAALAAAPGVQDCLILHQQQQQGSGMGAAAAAASSLPRSSPKPSRGRSSFTGNHSFSAHSHATHANVDDVRHAAGVGGLVVPPSAAAAHELDNASEISSAGTATTSRLMSVEAAAEELRRRELSVRQDWEMQQHRQALRQVGGGFIGQGKENGEWRVHHAGASFDMSYRTWQETACKPAVTLAHQPAPSSAFWSATPSALGSDNLTHRLHSFDPRVKREYCDMTDQVVVEPRRVQPRLTMELHPNIPFRDLPCLEQQQATAAAPWDASEAEARNSSGNYAKGAPVELNLSLNSSFPSKSTDQQQRKLPAAAGGGRVSSPSCGSVNSEGSVTSLHSSKCVSPWTLQLATESQSNRQLLPLLR